MSQKVLEVNDLCVSFKSGKEKTTAVDGVSFELYANQTLGIVGESGSGKSVSSLAIMGLLPKPAGIIERGDVTFFDKDKAIKLNSLPEAEMEKFRGNKISMIFQEPMTSLNPVLTCGEQVAEVLFRHTKADKKTVKEKVLTLFEKVKLPDPSQAWAKYPHQLSGGQKQRVMIAGALACNPSILIADEPTTALDVTVQKSILDLLAQLRQEYNMGIIFITHDLSVVRSIASHILVMYKGKLVEQEASDVLFSNPKHPYTQGLMACRPPVNKRPHKLNTVSDFVQQTKPKEEILADVKFENDTERAEKHSVLYANKPILEIKNLSVTFSEAKGIFNKKNVTKAVNDISFEVYEGETLGLVGESGCGKTTTGRAILRLLNASSGQIIYRGNDLTKLKPSELRTLRKNIQIIFQDPYSSLNPRQTIGSAIVEPMKVHGIGKNTTARKEMACALLEKTGLLAEHFSRYPHEFSGGQRQRICIARALSLQPEFIICDESVSALDVSVQAQVLNLLNQLKREYKFTYVFISHDLSVVRFMSDRMIVMHKGQIEEIGDSDSIFRNPQTKYAQNLLNAIFDDAVGA